MRKYVNVEVDVEVAMDEFDDEDLVEELESRGYFCFMGVDPTSPVLDRLHMAAKFSDQRAMNNCVRELLYAAKGVIV